MKKKFNGQLNLILDAIGGKVQKDSYACLSPMGKLVIFGNAVFTPGNIYIDNLKYLINEYLFIG